MTDSKTIKPTGQAHFIYGLVCGASAPDGIGKDFAIGEIEKVILSYASDRLNFELRGYRQLTSLYEKKINELEAEVAKWKDSSDGWRKMCHKAEADLTSLKSSLAEKEAELSTEKEVSAENERARVRWMTKANELEDKLNQMEKLVGGLDVENPSAVDTLIDAMKIQKENYLASLAQLQLENGVMKQRIKELEETISNKR